MEIPYTVSARRDTGLWNAKVGIWLFLASEVMLFGGLFSAYIFFAARCRAGRLAARFAERSCWNHEHRHPDRVIGYGGIGLGSTKDA